MMGRVVLVVAALAGSAGRSALAQEGVVDTLSRASMCKRAIANLQQGTQAYYSALAELPYCSAVGARALRSEWERPPSDTTAVRVLGEVTPRLRDRQVFDAVLAAFSDPVRPRELRLAALASLMGYYEPGLGARYVEPALAVQHGSAYVMMGQGDPVAAYAGPTPLSPGSRAEILQVLEQVGKQDPDERVLLISTYVHSRLSALPTVEQKDPAAAYRRAYCERARRTLRIDRPSSEKVQSMVTMGQCGDAGVETLVSYWRQPETDTVLLRALTEASARINDRRTYQAARAVVLDPSRSEDVRLGALTVLVAGFDPNIAVSFPTPTQPMYSTYVGIGFTSHASKRKGPQPVEPGAKADLISILKQLAGSDPNERMRKVATELGPLLERRM